MHINSEGYSCINASNLDFLKIVRVKLNELVDEYKNLTDLKDKLELQVYMD
jgi:hypothetical protein